MWHTLNSLCNPLYRYFWKHQKQQKSRSLTNNLSLKWRHSLANVTMAKSPGAQTQTPLEMDILNSNFTVQEVEAVMTTLKIINHLAEIIYQPNS